MNVEKIFADGRFWIELGTKYGFSRFGQFVSLSTPYYRLFFTRS